MEVGDEVTVFSLSDRATRFVIGKGVIDEIVPTIKGYDGPVACIRIPGMSGRWLRSENDLVN